MYKDIPGNQLNVFVKRRIIKVSVLDVGLDTLFMNVYPVLPVMDYSISSTHSLLRTYKKALVGTSTAAYSLHGVDTVIRVCAVGRLEGGNTRQSLRTCLS